MYLSSGIVEKECRFWYRFYPFEFRDLADSENGRRIVEEETILHRAAR